MSFSLPLSNFLSGRAYYVGLRADREASRQGNRQASRKADVQCTMDEVVLENTDQPAQEDHLRG